MKIDKKDIDKQKVRKWSEIGFPPLLLAILERRGLLRSDFFPWIFKPSKGMIFSPFYFSQLTRAIERIKEAVNRKERVCIFSDGDVDGVTSCIQLIDFFKSLEFPVDYYIPENEEPYGLSLELTERWKDTYDLIITADCGISNIAEVKAFKENNQDVIIIDHHHPFEQLPDAYAVINPKCEKNIAFDDMAASFVVFLFTLGFHITNSDIYNKEISILIEYSQNTYLYNTYLNGVIVQKKFIKDNQELSSMGYDYFIYFTDSHFNQELFALSRKKSLKCEDNFWVNTNNMESFAHAFLNEIIYTDSDDLKSLFVNEIQYATLGTLADVMPVLDVNRVLVKLGIASMKKSPLDSLNLMFNKAGIEVSDINTELLSWRIIPALNSPGRMKKPMTALRVFIDATVEAVDDVFKFNEERRKKGKEAYDIFYHSVPVNIKNYNDKFAFLYHSDIERGVTGITAGKLSEEYNVPVMIAALQGDEYIGSVRGKSQLHWVDFFENAGDLLTDFGGHHTAAGFRFHSSKLAHFKAFLKEKSGLVSDADDSQGIEIDAEVPVKYINDKLFTVLDILSPFGKDNGKPLLFTGALKVKSFNFIGKEKTHIKFVFENEDYPLIGLYWGKAQWFKEIHDDNNRYDVVYNFEINEFRGVVTLQMMIQYMFVSDRNV